MISDSQRCWWWGVSTPSCHLPHVMCDMRKTADTLDVLSPLMAMASQGASLVVLSVFKCHFHLQMTKQTI